MPPKVWRPPNRCKRCGRTCRQNRCPRCGHKVIDLTARGLLEWLRRTARAHRTAKATCDQEGWHEPRAFHDSAEKWKRWFLALRDLLDHEAPPPADRPRPRTRTEQEAKPMILCCGVLQDTTHCPHCGKQLASSPDALERAKAVNDDMVKVFYQTMGLQEGEECPDLQSYTLREMLDATEMVAADNDARSQARKGAETISYPMVCDPRLVAALYAWSHFPVERGHDIDPIVRARRRALILVEVDQ